MVRRTPTGRSTGTELNPADQDQDTAAAVAPAATAAPAVQRAPVANQGMQVVGQGVPALAL